jgi:hypothetical protein
LPEIADNPARVEKRMKKMGDGAGGLVEVESKFPVWFDPVADGGTPMCEALRHVNTVLTKWIEEHPKSFPPIVINITDGRATDGNGDPRPYADDLKKLRTENGNVLVFNCHIPKLASSPIEFPDNRDSLPDEDAQMLFDMSSVFPQPMRKLAKDQGFINFNEQTRGFVFNADLESVITFVNLGTVAKERVEADR